MNGAKSQGWPPTAEDESGDITLARPSRHAGRSPMAKTRSSLTADMARDIADQGPTAFASRIRVRVVDRFTNLPIYQQRRMTDAKVKEMKRKADAYADQVAQDWVEGRA